MLLSCKELGFKKNLLKQNLSLCLAQVSQYSLYSEIKKSTAKHKCVS